MFSADTIKRAHTCNSQGLIHKNWSYVEALIMVGGDEGLQSL